MYNEAILDNQYCNLSLDNLLLPRHILEYAMMLKEWVMQQPMLDVDVVVAARRLGATNVGFHVSLYAQNNIF